MCRPTFPGHDTGRDEGGGRRRKRSVPYARDADVLGHDRLPFRLSRTQNASDNNQVTMVEG